VGDTSGEAFSAPEILLVAQVAKPGQLQTIPQTLTSQGAGQSINVENQIYAPAFDSGTIRIAAGSVISATGDVHAGAGRNYYFADPTPDFAGANGKATTAQDIATALGGTLDASGTRITGADISKLSYFVKNADGSFVTNPDGTEYRHAGGIDANGLNALQNYSYQTKGLGALLVATNDTSLKVSGPSGVAAPSLTIQFGPNADPKVPGALNGSLVLPSDVGRVTLETGVSITAKVLTLQATASTNAIVGNSNDLHLQQLNVTAGTIGLGSSTVVTDKSVALYNQQFADVQALSLRALTGVVTVYGDFNPGVATRLTLDAAAVVAADNTKSANISLHGGTITLVNSGAASTAPGLSAGQHDVGLTFDAADIVLGGGTQSILGYGNVQLHATDRVFVAGPGSLTLGAGNDVVDFVVSAPSILVAGATATNGGSFEITTRGKGNIAVVNSVNQSGFPDRPADSTETGGSLKLTAKNIIIDSTIQAQAGTIALAASDGAIGVWLMPHAYLAAGGYKRTLVDVDNYLAGGKVVLSSDTASIRADAHSVIDVAQPAGGLGYGGEIDVTALGGGATLAGTLLGSGGPGHGGSFKLDIKGAADLTVLADQLGAGGITGAIDIHTRTGNLELSQGHTLKGNAIALTADDATWDVDRRFGQVYIGGLIDARGYDGATLDSTGQAGGQVALYGANSVTLASTGVIDASTTHADERGGDVIVGIGWGANSKIFLQTGTQINVSGGTKGGLSGGTIMFRAPLDGNNDVKIAGLSNVRNANGTFDELPVIDGNNVHIICARSLTVDGFVSFDTHASSHGIDGSSLGWGGTIDPAGWYKGVDSNGNLIPATDGSWTNVSGWQVSQITNFGTFTSVPEAAVTGGGGSGARATAVMGLVKPGAFSGIKFSVTVPAGSLSPNSPYTLVFPTPQGGVAAVATVMTDGTGQILTSSFSFAPGKVGSGYTDLPSTATISGLNVTATVSGIRMQVVAAKITNPGNGNYDKGSSAPIVSFGQATVSFVQGSGFSGTSTAGVFNPGTTDYIPFQSSGVFAFDPAKQGTVGVANFTGGAGTGRPFFETTLSQVTQGTWTNNGQSYGFSSLFNRLQPLVDQLGAGVVHVQPGVELVNSSGAIAVTSNWNLAAGTAGNLQTATNPTNNNQSFQYFDPALSYINFNYRLATPWGGLDAGALTLRAAGNININASISDGFFQFGDYLDPNYANWAATYALANRRSIDQAGGLYQYFLNGYSSSAVPIAPYKAAGNGYNPTSQDLATADLFPNTLRVCTVDCSAANIKSVTAPSSWSYLFTAGADVSSANPNARISLTNAQAGGKGDVIVDKHSGYNQTLVASKAAGGVSSSVFVNLPTMVRTGSGGIAIAAARDVIFNDTIAPGVIYAAGVNTAKLADPSYSLQTVNGTSRVVALNPDGFLEPRVLGYGNEATLIAGGAGLYYGPSTAAAFPEAGGDVKIDAQRDIVGNTSTDTKVPQYYQPWLLSDAGFAGTVNLFGAGVFAPSGKQIASQTAWWIQYGSFQQGILSAGGNVTLLAGRDLKDVSVSLPTTGRVSGGLSAGSTPVTHLYGSGNMVVRAGGNILGGSFYEGSGRASIRAGAAIGQNGTVSRYASSLLKRPDVPLLAVDTGQIEMVAGGSIMMAGVVNPAELHAQQPSSANPFEGNTSSPGLPLYMDTYGPDSKVRLVAEAGDLTITIAPTAISDGSHGLGTPTVNAAAALYPASFEALALNGSLITTGISDITASNRQTGLIASSVPMPGIVLSPSAHGTFELLAQNSIDLSFGYPKNTSNLLGATPRPYLSAGAALIETAFDAFQPDSGFDGAFSGAVLAHQDDAGLDTVAKIYAATGDITGTGSYGKRSISGDNTNRPGYQRIEINRPTKAFAGRDIVDLNIIVQNIHANDVSTIEAGRNIYYTGSNNAGGLQVAGPGFFVVQAGGDIGPFLPAAHDNSTEATIQEGIASVGNASPTAVGNIYAAFSGGGGSVGIYDAALLGPTNNPRRNSALTDAAGTKQCADIVTLFGVKFGVNYSGFDAPGGYYAGFIDAYLNPGQQPGQKIIPALPGEPDPRVGGTVKDITPPAPGSASGDSSVTIQYGDRNADRTVTLTDVTHPIYTTEALAFLAKVGRPASGADAASVYKAIKALPEDLQRVFADQIFFAELKAVGLSVLSGTTQNSRGYLAKKIFFPTEYGYTDNQVGGTHAVGQTVKTGDLNLLHATIQTQLGGDISIFGPGGNVVVGALAAEPNTKLKLRDLGILTLGGGAINSYTDGNVLVNSSRVLTTQGGDVLIWSSNGNIDAGRGSKTTLSAPALQVQYDQNDYQSIDLGGFVTGAGIGTLKASRVAKASSVYLLAPLGTIDFGTAGARSSADLAANAQKIISPGNTTASGTNTVQQPIAIPNIGALTSGSNTAGAAAKSADTPTAGGNRDQASVFIVEVVGYGGGDSQNEPPSDGKSKSDAQTPSDDKQ
jgi:hypothetical protein